MTGLLSSEQYGWNDIQVILGGRPLFGLLGIEVESGYTHEEVRASGAKAHAIKEKDYKCGGMVKVLQSEFDNLINSYGAGYQKVYFDIIWTFKLDESKLLSTYAIKKAKFGVVKTAAAQGDSHLQIDMPFMALDFIPNLNK